MRWLVTMTTLVGLVTACSGTDELTMTPPPPPEPTEALAIIEAREAYPTARELFSGRIQKTCSPNPGVCHNVNNYPDLKTAATMAQIVGAPCNIDVPSAEAGYDGCEQPPDQLILGELVAAIAFKTQEAPGRWRLTLDRFVPESGTFTIFHFADNDGTAIYSPADITETSLIVEAGTKEALLVVNDDSGFVAPFMDTITATLVEGDPNKNGVFGASDPSVEPARMIVPNSLERSYFWGRITGTVPGTRMPLANEALSNAEYAAIACWIESLPEDGYPEEDLVIDYDACDYAAAPGEHAADQ